MQKQTDFPSKNEFSILRVSFQMTCFFILSLLLALAVHVNISDQKYWLCRWWTGKIIAESKEKKFDHKRHHTTKNNRFNITDIFVQSDEMRFRSPSQRRQQSTWMRFIFSVKGFSTIHLLFKRAIFLRYCRSFFCVLFHDKLQDENVCEKTHLVFMSKTEAARKLSNTIKFSFRQLIVSNEIIIFVRTIRNSRRSFSEWMLRWS